MSGPRENSNLNHHRQRRDDFFSQNLAAGPRGLARQRAAATTNYAIAENWGEMLIFFIIGTLIFALTRLSGGNTEILTGFVIAILYMMNPLQFVLNTFPLISQAEVA